MIDKNTEPLDHFEEKKPKVVPGEYDTTPIELSWDIKFSRWVQRIIEGIQRGYKSTQEYVDPTKKKILDVLSFIKDAVKVLAKVLK